MRLGKVSALVLGLGGPVACLGSLVACGGHGSPGAHPGANGPSAQPGGETHESIGADAIAQGGLTGVGHPGGASSPPLAGSLKAERVDAKIKLDGVPLEWPARTAASVVVKGSPTDAKVAMTFGLQLDENNLYAAGEITDASFAAGIDHASLVLAVPSSGGSLAVHEIGFFAGKPGVSAGSVRFTAGARKGQDVPGAKIVEAPAAGGYTFEAIVPLAALPELRTVRVGLRGVARYYDGGERDGTILATGSGDASSPTTLPSIPSDAERAIIAGLLEPRGLAATAPKIDLYADVAGDPMKERISVFDRFLTICGPTYRGGKQFFYKDLGGEALQVEARDLTGRGKDDIVLRRRVTLPSGSVREWFEVWIIAAGDEPTPAFSQEIAVTRGSNKLVNTVHVAQKEIEVLVQPAVGWDGASYKEPVATDVAPILLPWGAVKSRTFKWDGAAGRFVKSKEVAQAPGALPPPGAAPAIPAGVVERRPVDPQTPPAKTGGDTAKPLLDQFRREHGVAADVKPKTDVEVNVSEDARPERVVLLGRDIVVFGPGFNGGNRYAFLTLSQFADADDVKDLAVRDLTGDGNADLVVRGVRHVTAQAQKEASGAPSGGPVPIAMEATFVYEVKGGAITRVFAIETAREQSPKRVQGLVQFVPAKSGKGFDIDVRPGRAIGWTDKTFPWGQEKPGSGALEPLLLPWGGIPTLRYAWNGTAFTQAP
jgi:hypothetical protein